MTEIDLLLVFAAGICAVVALLTDNPRFAAVGVLLLAIGGLT